MSLFKKTHLLKLNLNLTCFVHTFGHHKRFFFKKHFYQFFFSILVKDLSHYNVYQVCQNARVIIISDKLDIHCNVTDPLPKKEKKFDKSVFKEKPLMMSKCMDETCKV
jgi:hypothetical protein